MFLSTDHDVKKFQALLNLIDFVANDIYSNDFDGNFPVNLGRYGTVCVCAMLPRQLVE